MQNPHLNREQFGEETPDVWDETSHTGAEDTEPEVWERLSDNDDLEDYLSHLRNDDILD